MWKYFLSKKPKNVSNIKNNKRKINRTETCVKTCVAWYFQCDEIKQQHQEEMKQRPTSFNKFSLLPRVRTFLWNIKYMGGKDCVDEPISTQWRRNCHNEQKNVLRYYFCVVSSLTQ